MKYYLSIAASIIVILSPSIATASQDSTEGDVVVSKAPPQNIFIQPIKHLMENMERVTTYEVAAAHLHRSAKALYEWHQCHERNLNGASYHRLIQLHNEESSDQISLVDLLYGERLILFESNREECETLLAVPFVDDRDVFTSSIMCLKDYVGIDQMVKKSLQMLYTCYCYVENIKSFHAKSAVSADQIMTIVLFCEEDTRTTFLMKKLFSQLEMPVDPLTITEQCGVKLNLGKLAGIPNFPIVCSEYVELHRSYVWNKLLHLLRWKQEIRDEEKKEMEALRSQAASRGELNTRIMEMIKSERGAHKSEIAKLEAALAEEGRSAAAAQEYVNSVDIKSDELRENIASLQSQNLKLAQEHQKLRVESRREIEEQKRIRALYKKQVQKHRQEKEAEHQAELEALKLQLTKQQEEADEKHRAELEYLKQQLARQKRMNEDVAVLKQHHQAEVLSLKKQNKSTCEVNRRLVDELDHVTALNESIQVQLAQAHSQIAGLKKELERWSAKVEKTPRVEELLERIKKQNLVRIDYEQNVYQLQWQAQRYKSAHEGSLYLVEQAKVAHQQASADIQQLLETNAQMHSVILELENRLQQSKSEKEASDEKAEALLAKLKKMSAFLQNTISQFDTGDQEK